MRNKKQALYPVFIMIAFSLLALMIFLFMNNSSSYVLKEDGYQVMIGERFDYASGTAFEYREMGVALKEAKQGEYIPNSPIYLKENKNTIIIPNDTIYCSGQIELSKKVMSFSEISYDSVLHYNKVSLTGGFLFDGRNTYTFLEPMTVEINGQSYKVGRYSSITVIPNQAYCLYNTTNDQIMMEAGLSSFKAKCKNYTIDLENDILYSKNNEKILLFTNVDVLDELK